MFARHAVRELDGEIQVYCEDCSEWWPAADEFWPRVGGRNNHRPISFRRCRACFSDRQRKLGMDIGRKFRVKMAQRRYRLRNLEYVRARERERARARRAA